MTAQPSLPRRLRLAAWLSMLALGGTTGLGTTFDLDDEPGRAFSPETIIELVEGIVKRGGRRPSVLDTVDPAVSPARDLDVARRIRAIRLDIDLQGSDIRQILALLGEVTSLNLTISAKARRLLADEEIDVELSLDGLSIEHTLNLLAFQLGDYRFMIRHGAVRLVHLSEYRPLRATRYYDITDLIRPPRDFRAPKLGLTGLDDD